LKIGDLFENTLITSRKSQRVLEFDCHIVCCVTVAYLPLLKTAESWLNYMSEYVLIIVLLICHQYRSKIIV